MNKVMEIKRRHDLDALLRAIAPAMERNVARRRTEERRKAQINQKMARAGMAVRVV